MILNCLVEYYVRLKYVTSTHLEISGLELSEYVVGEVSHTHLKIGCGSRGLGTFW